MSVVPTVVGHIDPWHAWRDDAATLFTFTAEGTLSVFAEVRGKWPDRFKADSEVTVTQIQALTNGYR